MTDIYEKMTSTEFNRKLRASDRRTYKWYKQCSNNQLYALKGHPLYQDITLKSVSSQEKEKP